jgi:hypothetical protein
MKAVRSRQTEPSSSTVALPSARSARFLEDWMVRKALLRVMARCGACLVLLSACSGKTERSAGGANGDGAPVQRPAAGPVNAEAVPTTPATHLLMVVELEPATHVARVLTARSVELPLPRRRGPQQQKPWRVDVLGAAGQVLFSAPLEDAATVRGEFPNANGQLSGVTAQKRVAAVTLRLPWLDGASEVRVLSVSNGRESELGRVAYPRLPP